MDALRKQASKFREQVAKQQQAVIKQFTSSGYESSDVMVTDEAELQRHQQLEKLYSSTRTGKNFQRDVLRAAEGFMANGLKQIEIGMKLAEDCRKYGVECNDNGMLLKAASLYASARAHVEKEQEEFNRTLSSQVLEPLRSMVTGAPLEDARHLAQRYSRMRHEAEQQAAEVSRRQAKSREAPIIENSAKLQVAESKMHEIRANMVVLGKEATAALAAIESQQQRMTLQRLIAMVVAERLYHRRVAEILDDVEAQMLAEKQRKESAPPVVSPESSSEKALYFLAEAIHAFTAGSEKELSLSVGDYVVVRQVTPVGWSEGECGGKAGWFPSAFVERRQGIPSNKVVAEVF
ncbi:hypothetical protein AMTRI_Chr02g215470 [Amborella trichopoda]